jgi:hydroxymethylbilane synthase
MAETLVIGSRGSQLALWQARWIQSRLTELGVPTRIEIIKTTGDKITDVPLSKVGSKGLFTKEIEEALLDGRVDCAVHSLKDLPTELPPGLILAAIAQREDPRDALVGMPLEELPHGARVGTSSLRRAAQLHGFRPDLVIESLRGNLDTRLRKLDEGMHDAVVLASAGLQRLGWSTRISQILPPRVMCPAAGQGALAVETRADGGRAQQVCALMDHAATRAAVTAERAVLAGLGGGCQVPIGAYAEVRDGQMTLQAVVVSPSGESIVRHEASGPVSDAERLGKETALRLLESGARAILADVYGQPLAGRRVVVTRAAQQAGELSARLQNLGADVIELPVIDLAPPAAPGPLRDAVRNVDQYDWIIFTSVNGVRFFFEQPVQGKIRAKVCAIGPVTADAARSHGLEVELVPAEYVAEKVVEAFARYDLTGAKILLPRAAIARDVIPIELRKRGAQVDVVEAYRNVIPQGLEKRAKAVFNASPKPDWVTLTSSSTVTNLLSVTGVEVLAGIRLASIGPVTSQVARQHGLEVAVEASPFTVEGLVEAMVAASRQEAT